MISLYHLADGRRTAYSHEELLTTVQNYKALIRQIEKVLQDPANIAKDISICRLLIKFRESEQKDG